MILNCNRLCAIIIIANTLFLTNLLFAELTTLQHFDPAPNFSCNDSMMPPNSQFLDLKQAEWKNEVPCKKRGFGLTITGFIQGASRAKGYNGETNYGTVVGIPENGFEMGDFRGTMYAMGLFLGANPATGNTIWGTSATSGDLAEIANSQSITTTTIQNFNLPDCLEDAMLNLSGNLVNGTVTTPPTNSALVFNSGAAASNIPSIFSEGQLARDTKYFGAFSMPILYRKQGVRFEANIDVNDCIQFTIQGGAANIQQKYTNTIATQTTTSSTSCAPVGQTAPGPYSISNVATVCASGSTGTSTVISSLYTNLNQTGSGFAAAPNTVAQTLFNKYISNNLDSLLDPDCGIDQSACAFDKSSIEDVRFTLTLQRAYDPRRFNSTDEDDTWPDMIFTPYVWVGGTAPVAKEIDYSNILSLPFGNNGHASAGGGLGMTFDFAESVEVGFEGGATYFFAKNEHRPFPTSPLQRVIYPFSTDVRTQPGLNWNVKVLLNAYQFLKHVSFWFSYELVEHCKDSFKVCDSSQAEYFFPETLRCLSDWRGQFFNAAITFDIQPGIQASFLWQQPLAPRNAYYPVTIMGSISFMF